MSTQKYLGLVLEGGGPAGVAHVGALQVLHENGILSNIHHFIGSSAGAIVAFMLACNADMSYLEKTLFNTNFTEFMDDSWGFVRDLTRLIKNYGWYKGDALEQFIRKVLEELTGNPNITFKEIQDQYGNFLEVTVTDLNIGNTIYLNPETTPNMKVSIAIKRSSLIPLFFRSDQEEMDTEVIRDEGDGVEIKKLIHYFCDGGILNNYPINRLDDKIDPNSVIGLKLMTSRELNELQYSNASKHPYPPKNIISYIKIIYNILNNQALKIHVKDADWKRTLAIDVGTISLTDFDLSDSDKKFLIEQGRKGALKFLN